MRNPTGRRPGRPAMPRFAFTCAGESCHEQVWRTAKAAQNTRRFFCPACIDKSNTPDVRTCQSCGAPFSTYQSSNAIRCQECRVRARTVTTSTCQACGEPFQQSGGQGHLACPACRAVDPALNSARGRKTVQRVCETCSEPFEAYQTPSRAAPVRFCGNECRTAWFSGAFARESSPHWRGGTHGYGGWWRRLSRAIAERDGRLCRCCGLHEDELPRNLIAAHIFPHRAWHETEEVANHPANLVALCITCHAQFDRNPATRFDYTTGRRPSWPGWIAQPVGLKVDQALVVVAEAERLSGRLVLDPSILNMERLVVMTETMAGACAGYGVAARRDRGLAPWPGVALSVV